MPRANAPACDVSAGHAPRVDPRRALGRRGEQFAQRHLRHKGFSILARNARTRHGEIDLVAFKDATIAFVEVKTRTATAADLDGRAEQAPLARLRARQRTRLRRLALAWLSQEQGRRPHAQAIRFDAVGVLVDRRGRLVALEHVEDAW